MQNVLIANSAVFERMLFTPNCKEIQSGVFKLADTKATVIEALIEFMHRGKVDDLNSVAIDLFKLSHKYGVYPLHVS